MKTRILVVDDEVTGLGDDQDRKADYEGLKALDGSQIEIEYASSPLKAMELLRRRAYDVVMIDVWLEHGEFKDDEHGTAFQQVFLAAAKVATVALISSSWDNTVVPRVNRLLTSNPTIGIPLMLGFDALRSNHHAAVVLQIQAHVRQRREGLVLEIGPNDPINVLHISDLHFGSKHTLETLAGEANQSTLATAILRDFGGSPHFIAITGDISNTGHPEEYQEALKWLKEFSAELEMAIPSRRLLLVPGNHDFSLPVSLSSKVVGKTEANGHLKFSLGKATPRSNQLSAYATRGYVDFAVAVNGPEIHGRSRQPYCWMEAAFREYGVVFTGLNTCGRTKPDAWPERWIDNDDAAKLAKRLRELGEQDLFHLMLSHHPPVRTNGGREPIGNVEAFETLFLQDADALPHVILHGHEHARRGDMPWADRILSVCAPSPSVRENGRPPDSLRGVNLVTLVRRDGLVMAAQARSIVFEANGWQPSGLANHNEVHREVNSKPRKGSRAPAAKASGRTMVAKGRSG